MSNRFYVRIDRTDGSRTYKGPFSDLRAQHEAAAWHSAFPEYEVVWGATDDDTQRDVRRFNKATRDGGRYYPQEARS